MQPITPPEPVRSALNDLVSMSPSAFQNAYALLARAGELERAQTGAPAISNAQLEEFENCIMSLQIGRMQLGLQRDDFVDGIAAYVKRSSATSEVLVSKDVVERIRSLMELPRFANMGRAYFLGNEHERIFDSARILTDIRPVFSEDDVESKPDLFVLSHTLKIKHTLASGETDAIFIKMDDEDIHSLLKTCERASRKATTLEKLGDTSDFRVFRVGDT